EDCRRDAGPAPRTALQRSGARTSDRRGGTAKNYPPAAAKGVPMSPITTHVLDTAHGRPAQGVAVVLGRRSGEDVWTDLARGVTNADGRIMNLLPDGTVLEPGVYRLWFGTGNYFAALGVRGFYTEVQVIVHLEGTGGHYHIPLLLSPFGYSTYRGS